MSVCCELPVSWRNLIGQLFVFQYPDWWNDYVTECSIEVSLPQETKTEDLLRHRSDKHVVYENHEDYFQESKTFFDKNQN